jgi:hypothetical protein
MRLVLWSVGLMPTLSARKPKVDVSIAVAHTTIKII